MTPQMVYSNSIWVGLWITNDQFNVLIKEFK